MGWNYRKSINLGGGLRLNLSKSGVGISGGVKGFRIGTGPRGTRLTASIPGTGLYYTKNLSGGKKNSINTTNNAQQNTRDYASAGYLYSQIVSNDYTGETRELRASTQYELNRLVQNERERQTINEHRQRLIDTAKSEQQKVDAMNQQIATSRKELENIINQTLSVNDRLDWDKLLVKSDFPPLQFNEKPPVVELNYKIGFFKSLFMNENKFELPDIVTDEMRAYEERRNNAIADYLRRKSRYDADKNKKNGELIYLRRKFEESDKSAVERYISIVLTQSKYPVDFEHDFEVKYDRNSKSVIVNYLFQDIDAFPITEKYIYDASTNRIEEVLMKREIALDFYSNVLYSVGMRTMHEVFESVYTDAVDSVTFYGFIEDKDDNQRAFGLRSTRKDFEIIDLRLPLSKILTMVESKTIGDFTNREKITPFE